MLYFLHVQWLSILNLPYTVKLAGLLKNICVFFSSTNKHCIMAASYQDYQKSYINRLQTNIPHVHRNKTMTQAADSLKKADSRKDWRQERRMTEDEMVGSHHQFIGQELGQTSGGGEEQSSLAGCSPQGCGESDTTRQLNSNNPEMKTP